jgi:hypothetical protein
MGFFGFFALALGLVVATSATAEWDRAEALSAIHDDMSIFLSVATLGTWAKEWAPVIHTYAENRTKGVRPSTFFVMGLAEFISSPLADNLDEPQRDAVYEAMLARATAINETFAERTPYIEGVPTRGWPFIIHKNILEFGSHQRGHMMQAVACGAEQAALHGEHEKAASLALAVAAALHDGFLTTDLERAKVDSNGAVDYVPRGASSGRFRRSKEVQSKGTCLDHPQALNHGLLAAEGAIALLRACNAIDWDEAEWRLVDAKGSALTKESFLSDTEAFVVGSVDVLLKAFTTRKTGMSSNDRYNGPDGTEWYEWKYFAHPCPSTIGTNTDRWEDIAHAGMDVGFVSLVRKFGRDYYGDADHFLDSKHLRALQVTFLNRLVVDRSITGGGRFACDVSGNAKGSKSCRKSRAEITRHYLFIHFFPVSVELKDDLAARCDALNVVGASMPLFLPGRGADLLLKRNGLDVYFRFMEAKYHFYNFEAALHGC